MSLPESFSIFSPSFSLFRSITPVEYLTRSQKVLEQLPQWKEVSLAISIVSLTILFTSLGLAIVFEDEAKSKYEQGRGYKVAMKCGVASLVTLFITLAAYPTMTYGLQPLLEKRIDWLQSALASS